ncbi:Response regulator PleD [Vibrio aerogenes CECT 7868]|uniref:diguanylate cyclase n=1 Tax=Vibrio aerogenes CECT 7868 TaxID=1216006 RepID=A0A1M5XR36_9VIBR|nr:sensor domain-containing diguanylate cyclase [Vibrio aerogenes]SHI01723.1 Response regulator PleD [Vibrio aerogenes CECT 7868]
MSAKRMNFIFNEQGQVLALYKDTDIQDYSDRICHLNFRTANHSATFQSDHFYTMLKRYGKLELSTVIDQQIWSGSLVFICSVSGDVPAEQMLLTLHGVSGQITKETYHSVLPLSPSATYHLDLKLSTIQNISPNVAILTGFSPEIIQGQADWWMKQIHPEDKSKYLSHIEACCECRDDHFYGTEYRFCNFQGDYIWLADRARVMFDPESQEPVGLVGCLIDISEIMKLYNQLVSLTAVAPGMIYQYEHTSDGQISFSYMSPQVQTLFGKTADEIKNDIKQLFNAVHPADRKRLYRSIIKAEKGQKEWKCEFRVLNHGEVRWLYGHSVPVNMNHFRQVWSGLLIDISDKKSLEFKLKRESTTDPLTGLFNRRYFMNMLEETFDGGVKQLPVSILAVDFDHFKQINDQYGHDVGDQVLRQVATGMKQNLRKTDTLARVGGEEFSVILPATHYKDALRIGEKLRHYVETMVISYQDFNINITITVGVASSDGHLAQKELLIRADRALYQGKSSGRNRVM